MNDCDPLSKLAKKRERLKAMSAVWPNWRVAYKILGRPPWPVMEWLGELYKAGKAGEEAFASLVACGGFSVETVANCECVRPESDAIASSTLTNADSLTTGQLMSIYGRLSWTAAERSRLRAFIVLRELKEINGDKYIANLEHEDAMAWLHANHRNYNRAQRRVIEETIGVKAVRSLLKRDMKVENKILPECGRILEKRYAQDLITHFLNTPVWC